MTLEQFHDLIVPITRAMAGRPVDHGLESWLNVEHGPETATPQRFQEACKAGIAAGWMCAQGAEGRRFGRVIQPTPATQDFSVDVVQIRNAHGPHHSHPNGEILLILPQSPAARFDARGLGWKVYPPGSAHYPTVTGGEAIVVYLLPGGAIAFTK